ncbi:LysE family transporter (plasmid) [Roseomonas sp. CCTCC AB2023176]|uniref:LysE family transporter n=1 Tax=Roseomonas sp. CCTCC AB2023176 TaxID=3342640 RepID=UPI0035DF1554
MIAPDIAGTLLRGAGIGLAIAAPVGPIALLCIRRTLAAGPAAGVASGVGAATADALYGLVAALGLGVLAAVLVDHAALLRVAGGLLLAWLGLGALRRALAPPHAVAEAAAGREGTGLAGAFASTFALTLANPMTILSFAGVVAALAAPGGGAAAGLALVAGVFLGSVAWWLLLVGSVAAVRGSLPSGALRWIEGLSGAALLGFGAYALLAGLGVVA